MTEKTWYIAQDGAEFETKEECEQYERRYEKGKSIIFFDEKSNNLWDEEDWYKKFEDTFYMFICNAEDAKDFFHFFGNEMGAHVPDDDLLVENTIVAYDDDDYDWYNLTEKIEKLSKAERKIMSQIIMPS